MKHYWLTLTYLEDGDEDDDKILINPTTYSEIVFYLTSIIYL